MYPIVETDFTPWASLGGGILIGLSAVMVMGLLGRIAGITGISAGAMKGMIAAFGQSDQNAGDWQWRVAFLVGLLASPALVMVATGTWPAQTVPSSLIGMMVAGLLVGYGTRRGAGCTSGHGVCGLARLSVRSMVAVATFLGTAVVTVFIVRHVIGGGA